MDHLPGEAKGGICRPARSCESIRPPSGPLESLMPLMTVEPNCINGIDNEEWVAIDVAVDSEATETVMGEETLAGVINIAEGPASKRV